ncbi:MAG: leucyl aminopeptidase [Armatimonadetes bacterium]|nr:leucyl aminopeptidase [Armatimonadota bacterium]
MRVTAATGDLTQFAGDGIIVGLYEDVGVVGVAEAVDRALGGVLQRLLASGGVSAKKNKLTVLHPFERLPAARVVAVGLGNQETVTLEEIRQATGEACRRLRNEHARRIAADVLGGGGLLDPQQAAEAMVEGAVLGSYRFSRYRTKPEDEAGIESLALFAGADVPEAALRRGIEVGQVKAAATCFARDLVNTPPSELVPADLCEVARNVAVGNGLVFDILSEDELALRGLNLILAVNRGSDNDAALIVLKYRGGADERALGLVGKGVCFDSGGLSIKSADGMMTMKGDMGGAAAVIATMQAVAQLDLPLNVTAVVPAVQNLVGGNATMPGDVVTGFGGKSVEILNTDAEGRLILSDALAYATGELMLTPVIDIATLTGACMRALGPIYAGILGTDEELVDRLCLVGRQAGEKFWPMPLDEEYRKMLDSTIADMKNISGHLSGGASTAAMLLKEFVGDTPWAHLDVAGHMFAESDEHYQPKGATGFGVRTLINYCLSRSKHSD